MDRRERYSLFNPFRAKELAAYICKRRRVTGLTKAEIARLLGVSEQFYGRIENAKGCFPEYLVFKLIPLLNLRERKVKRAVKAYADEYVDRLFIFASDNEAV